MQLKQGAELNKGESVLVGRELFRVPVGKHHKVTDSLFHVCIILSEEQRCKPFLRFFPCWSGHCIQPKPRPYPRLPRTQAQHRGSSGRRLRGGWGSVAQSLACSCVYYTPPRADCKPLGGFFCRRKCLPCLGLGRPLKNG